MQCYNASTSVGVGWLTDGVFDTGTEVQLTRSWSINAGYQHIWNPKWKTSWFGGYVNVSYNDTAKNIINSHLPGAAGTTPCGVPVAGAVFPPITIAAGNGNACSPNFSFYEIGSRTQWNPVAQLDIGLEVLYTHLNTAYKGAGIYPANGSRPARRPHRRPEHLVCDVPLAAQFLSMICCSIVATSRNPRRETAGGSAFLRRGGPS